MWLTLPPSLVTGLMHRLVRSYVAGQEAFYLGEPGAESKGGRQDQEQLGSQGARGGLHLMNILRFTCTWSSGSLGF